MGRYIMNDKVYDTEKSTKLASGHISEPSAWYSYINITISVELWKTTKGNYFFVRVSDRNRGQPINEDQARDFLKKNDYDAYVKEFGELEEA